MKFACTGNVASLAVADQATRLSMTRRRRGTFTAVLFMVAALLCNRAWAEYEYALGTGDILKITVFQNPDLSTESRVSEAGNISFPLVGAVHVAGLTLSGAERQIAKMLKEGSFVLNPQVNILLTQAVSDQVSVLGYVNKPGRYSIETAGRSLSAILAAAGGISPTGGDTVVLAGIRNGKPMRREIDVLSMFLQDSATEDMPLIGGDTVFVKRAPAFYIYGEVQKPGVFRLERNMTLMQAVATGGGITAKGTLRGIVVNRRSAAGEMKEMSITLSDRLMDDDVVYVKQSLF